MLKAQYNLFLWSNGVFTTI